MSDPLLSGLIDALRVLPGVGQKSAQRMAYHLLQHERQAAVKLAQMLLQAVDEMGHCERCHTFTRDRLCNICTDPTRDTRQLCVVETPADLAALERTGSYQGLYFVLAGAVSPLDGVGMHDTGVPLLMKRAQDGVIEEVVLATNFTAQGEVTAHVVTEQLRASGLRVTRLARGVPVGSELEYVDLGTIAHALMDRR